MNDTGTPQRRGRLGSMLLAGACLFLAGAAAATVYKVYFKRSPHDVPPDAAPPVVVGDISPEIHQFCGACHQYPPPDTFPRSAWRQEVERGYVFFENSSLHMGAPPLEADQALQGPGAARIALGGNRPGRHPLPPPRPPDRP